MNGSFGFTFRKHLTWFLVMWFSGFNAEFSNSRLNLRKTRIFFVILEVMGRDEKLVSLGFKGGLRFFRMDALADSSAYAWRVSIIHIFIRVIRGSRNGLVETINLAVRIYTLFIPLSCRLFNSWSHNRIFSWTFFTKMDFSIKISTLQKYPLFMIKKISQIRLKFDGKTIRSCWNLYHKSNSNNRLFS